MFSIRGVIFSARVKSIFHIVSISMYGNLDNVLFMFILIFLNYFKYKEESIYVKIR